LIKIFEEYELVVSTYKIISNGKIYEMNQLTTPSNISEGFIVYEKLSIEMLNYFIRCGFIFSVFRSWMG